MDFNNMRFRWFKKDIFGMDIHVSDQRENENVEGILRGPRGPKRISIGRIFMSVTNEKTKMSKVF